MSSNPTEKKKGKAGKFFLKLFAAIIVLALIAAAASEAASALAVTVNIKRARSFTSCAGSETLRAKTDKDGSYYFVCDRDFKVLELTDIHLGGGWRSFREDQMAMNAAAAMISAEKPDLVVVTGDIAYPVPHKTGTVNNRGAAKLFASLMEQLGVNWTVTLGEHDAEFYSIFNRSRTGDYYAGAQWRNCLFGKSPEGVDGVGNSYINIKNSDGIITRTLFMIDSADAADDELLGAFGEPEGIRQNQVDWYEKTVKTLSNANQSVMMNMDYEKQLSYDDFMTVPSVVFTHLPLEEYKTAWAQYRDPSANDTVFFFGKAGEQDEKISCSEKSDELFEKFLELGSTQGVFCGHDHKNNFSVSYKGIRLTYGMSLDYFSVPGIASKGAQRGCTVITLSPDGGFDCTSGSYYTEKYKPFYSKENVTMDYFIEDTFAK